MYLSVLNSLNNRMSTSVFLTSKGLHGYKEGHNFVFNVYYSAVNLKNMSLSPVKQGIIHNV